MSRKPFFSVIIPSLNEEKFLPVLLKSLSQQTYPEYEVIVVDGGSKDNTEAAFEEWAASIPGARFIASDKANVGYQRNLGAKDAKGEYFVFLDADVNVERTFLEELHLIALKKKFDLATTWIDPDSDKPVDHIMTAMGNFLNEVVNITDRPFTGGYNTIVKKDIFQRLHGFREDLMINEDHDFAIRANKMGIKTTLLKEPRVVYSLRRFRAEGTLSLLRKYTHGQIYNLFKGPITKEIFEYDMGGQAHKKKRKKKLDLKKLEKYLKSIGKIEKKISDLFRE